MANSIDINSLARRILDFLDLRMQWLPSSKQVMLFDNGFDDVVTALCGLSNGCLIEMPIESRAIESRAIESRVDDASKSNELSIAASVLINSLESIKFWSYGIDIGTLQPKNTVENPFFGMRSLEEIAMKLDLHEA